MRQTIDAFFTALQISIAEEKIIFDIRLINSTNITDELTKYLNLNLEIKSLFIIKYICNLVYYHSVLR